MSSNIDPDVVIDDTDSRIQYKGQGWFEDHGSQDNIGNYGATYNHTQHGTTGNDSFSFSFEGTTIFIVGTFSRAKTGNGIRIDPAWDCYVDNVWIEGSGTDLEDPSNNVDLCGNDKLNSGQHEITVNISTTGRPFWFDYITFTPLRNATLDNAVLYIDSSDLGISYDSQWGDFDKDDVTASITSISGAQMRFNFTGTGISWVGIVPTESPHGPSSATYSIDGGSPVYFRLNGLPPNSTSTLAYQVFFSTPALPAGPHSLLVTYQGNNQVTPLALQYLLVSTITTPQSPPSSSSPPVTSLFIPTTTQISGSAPSHSSKVGAIAGGVVGGVVLVALTLLAFLWCRKRRRHITHPSTTQAISTSGPHVVSPFTSPNPVPPLFHSQTGRNFVTIGSQKPTPAQISPSSSKNPIMTRSETTAYSPWSEPSGSIHASENNMVTGAQTRATGNPLSIMHNDSGLRLPNGGMITEVPPLYTAD